MIWFSLFIPLFVSIVVYFFIKDRCYNKSETLLGLLIIPTVAAALIILIMSLIMEHHNASDIEYLAYHYVKIRHEDEWNEKIRVRKTRTKYDSNGNSHEETYYVDETKYHPEKHIGYLNNNRAIDLYSNEYNEIKKLWNVPMKFIDMHRRYHTIDGDAQEYVWNRNRETLKPYVIESTYNNKILGSQSTFKFNEINKEEADTLGLYDYPVIKKHLQNPIVGYTKYVSKRDIKQMMTLNSLYGKDKEISFFILIYPNTEITIVEDQRSYWQGGNKNEFVICVGIDSLTNKVQWSQCFSWLDDITMEVECRNFINKQNTFNINQLSDWLENNLHLWKRKEFKDFDYLNVTLSDEQEIAILWTVIILSVLFGIIYIFYNKQ